MTRVISILIKKTRLNFFKLELGSQLDLKKYPTRVETPTRVDKIKGKNELY